MVIFSILFGKQMLTKQMHCLWLEVRFVRMAWSNCKTVSESLTINSLLKGIFIIIQLFVCLKYILLNFVTSLFLWLIVYLNRYLPLLKTAKLRKMSFFDAVFSSGISIPEDLMNQAKSLIQQIGPYVEDQEYLQLICLLQMLKPPKKWIDPVSR